MHYTVLIYICFYQYLYIYVCYIWTGAELTGDKVTDMWYEEEKKYNYRDAKFSSSTGKIFYFNNFPNH